LIVDNDMHSSSRPVAAIAVLDCMVQEHLKEGEKQRWMTNVVKPWYNSSELLADDVLCRANIFLRNFYEGTGGIKILLKAFETGSYAVFATMPSLTSLFFFQHLELKKLGCLQSGKAGSACAAGVAVAPVPLLHGFKLCVSSGGRFFHNADADRPTRNIPAVIQGLRCLAHLRDSDWETLGPVKSARKFLQEEEQCVGQSELLTSAQKQAGDECQTDLDTILVETQSLAAETSAVFARLHLNALETEVSEVTASATSDDIDTDDDIPDSSGLEDNSHEDSTILEESMLDAHDIPRSRP